MLPLLASLLVPTAAWYAGWTLAHRRVPLPAGILVPAGVLFPPLAIAWARRQTIEQVTAWTVAVVGWGGLLIGHDPQVLAASSFVGAVWSAGLAMWRTDTHPHAPPVSWPRKIQPTPKKREETEVGFLLEVPCPTCGAPVLFPVYHRMCRCRFCASQHMVRSDADFIETVIPDTVTDRERVTDSVVKHLRYLRYQQLYDRRVRPLVQREAAAREDGVSTMLKDTSPSAAVVAAEASVTAAADRYAESLRTDIQVERWDRFLAPYWHHSGTLYQVGFGRDSEDDKRMEFVVAYLEDSQLATGTALPEMGKLSYLRALNPLRGSPEQPLPALAVDTPPGALQDRLEHRASRTSGFSISVITQRSTFVPAVRALVWRPWHNVSVTISGQPREFLLDGGSGNVSSCAPPAVTAKVPRDLGKIDSIALRPSRCPECGAELAFSPEASAHLCLNCYRTLELAGRRWNTLPYLRDQQTGPWVLPFWRFPFRLRAAGGALIEDLDHLTDGIDGTFDQIGKAPVRDDSLMIPAFRVRLSKNGIRLYRLLWLELRRNPPRLLPRPFSPSEIPRRIVGVTLPAEEARVFASIYLALAFTRRDLARAEIKGVRERFLDTTVEGSGQLAYVSFSEEVMGPHRNLVAVPVPPAVARLRGS